MKDKETEYDGNGKPITLLSRVKNYINRSFSKTNVIPSGTDIAKKFGVGTSTAYKYVSILKSRDEIEKDAKNKDNRFFSTWNECSVPCNINGVMLEIEREDGSKVTAKNISNGYGDTVVIGNDVVPLKYFKRWRQLTK